MTDWTSYRNNIFSSDHAEDILWLIFDKALNKNISDFHELMRRASKGSGYSAHEYLGYSLIHDYDLGTNIPGVVEVECGSEEFEMSTSRFAELLKVACVYYVQQNGKHHEELVTRLYNRFCSTHNINVKQ